MSVHQGNQDRRGSERRCEGPGESGSTPLFVGVTERVCTDRAEAPVRHLLQQEERAAAVRGVGSACLPVAEERRLVPPLRADDEEAAEQPDARADL
jgi:hypothetical protein